MKITKVDTMGIILLSIVLLTVSRDLRKGDCTVFTVSLPKGIPEKNIQDYVEDGLKTIVERKEGIHEGIFPINLTLGNECSKRGTKIYSGREDLPIKDDCLDKRSCFFKFIKTNESVPITYKEGIIKV